MGESGRKRFVLESKSEAIYKRCCAIIPIKKPLTKQFLDKTPPGFDITLVCPVCARRWLERCDQERRLASAEVIHKFQGHLDVDEKELMGSEAEDECEVPLPNSNEAKKSMHLAFSII